MVVYPRYVQAGTVKWEKPDLDALCDHVIAGETVTGFLAYPYSFIVRDLGSDTYDAINAIGTRVYGTSADATGIIQSCIDDVETAGGGVVGIKTPVSATSYPIDDTLLNDSPGLMLVGEGTTTVLKLINTSGFAATQPILSIAGDAAKSFRVSNLCIDGNKANNTGGIGINAVSTTTTDAEMVPTIDHVLVKNCYNDGLSIGDGGYGIGIHVKNSAFWSNHGYGIHMIGSDCQFSDLVVAQSDGAGIFCWGGVSLYENIKLFGNGRSGASAGVWVDGTAPPSTHNQFINVQSDENYGAGFIIKGRDNTFTGCTAYRNGWGEAASGFYLFDATYNNFVGCLGVNTIATGVDFPQLNGFQEAGASDYNNVSGCIFRDNTNEDVIILGTHTKVHNTIGYVDYNSGYSTGTGAQQTIAHGVSFTPTAANVILTDIEVGAIPYCSAAPDADNIYVLAAAGQDYRWEVKRSP